MQHGIDDALHLSEDGASGAIGFRGIEGGGRSYGLGIFYQAIPPESQKDELITVLNASEADESGSIFLGTLKGRLYITYEGLSALLTARAWSQDGVVLEIELSATPYDPHALKILRDICRSVEYQDTWMPRSESRPSPRLGVPSEVSP